MNKFNVIIYDINGKKFTTYDVLPYLRNSYNERVENFKKLEKKIKRSKKKIDESILNEKYNKVPSTFKEFREFVNDESRYQFWSRCEYEIILSDWPPSNPPIEEKWDVYDQIVMNIDLVTKLLMEDVIK